MTSLSLSIRDCFYNLPVLLQKKINLNLPPLLSFLRGLREKGQGGLESRRVKVGQSSANFTVTACRSKGVFFFSSNRSSVCSVKKSSCQKCHNKIQQIEIGQENGLKRLKTIEGSERLLTLQGSVPPTYSR